MNQKEQERTYMQAIRTLQQMEDNLSYVIETNEDFLKTYRDAGLIEHTAYAETELALQRLQWAAIRYAIAHMQPTHRLRQ